MFCLKSNLEKFKFFVKNIQMVIKAIMISSYNVGKISFIMEMGKYETRECTTYHEQLCTTYDLEHGSGMDHELDLRYIFYVTKPST